MLENNYLKYRGKCKEFVDEAVKADPTLNAVRGFYHCHFDGKQEHWWTRRPDGTIFDPTVKQFKSDSMGEYEEFNGTFECDECGTVANADDMLHESRYHFCSGKCNARFVGIEI